MAKRIQGSFEVKGSPLPVDDVTKSIGAMRMSFEKVFAGELSATSVVSMLGIMDQATGSGGYVALERVTGTLDGKSGSFSLQHSSTMTRGKPAQSVRVIPDSGTEELVGLAGEMTIDIVEGKHFYTFNYEI